MTSCIYDFETLSQDVFDGVAVNLAGLRFDEDRFIHQPYKFEELVDSCKFIKFDVEEQVKKYDRKIQQSSLDWWKQKDKAAQKLISPSKDDVSIEELYAFVSLELQLQNCDRVYTRGNTFDPILLSSLLRHFDRVDPTKWWVIRDTRSLFEGMTYGHGIKSTFIPEGLEDKFIAHDPCHDVAMDVMRYQHLARILNDG